MERIKKRKKGNLWANSPWPPLDPRGGKWNTEHNRALHGDDSLVRLDLDFWI